MRRTRTGNVKTVDVCTIKIPYFFGAGNCGPLISTVSIANSAESLNASRYYVWSPNNVLCSLIATGLKEKRQALMQNNHDRVLEIASRQPCALLFRSVKRGIMANANQCTLGSTRTVFKTCRTRGIVPAKHMLYRAEPCQASPISAAGQTDPAFSFPNLQLILLLLHTFLFLQLVVDHTLPLISLDFPII